MEIDDAAIDADSNSDNHSSAMWFDDDAMRCWCWCWWRYKILAILHKALISNHTIARTNFGNIFTTINLNFSILLQQRRSFTIKEMQTMFSNNWKTANSSKNLQLYSKTAYTTTHHITIIRSVKRKGRESIVPRRLEQLQQQQQQPQRRARLGISTWWIYLETPLFIFRYLSIVLSVNFVLVVFFVLLLVN